MVSFSSLFTWVGLFFEDAEVEILRSLLCFKVLTFILVLVERNFSIAKSHRIGVGLKVLGACPYKNLVFSLDKVGVCPICVYERVAEGGVDQVAGVYPGVLQDFVVWVWRH